MLLQQVQISRPYTLSPGWWFSHKLPWGGALQTTCLYSKGSAGSDSSRLSSHTGFRLQSFSQSVPSSIWRGGPSWPRSPAEQTWSRLVLVGESRLEFSGVLWAMWCHIGSLKSAMVGVFAPWRLANFAHQTPPSPWPVVKGQRAGVFCPSQNRHFSLGRSLLASLPGGRAGVKLIAFVRRHWENHCCQTRATAVWLWFLRRWCVWGDFAF